MTDFVGNGCFLQKIGYNYIKSMLSSHLQSCRWLDVCKKEGEKFDI